MKSISFECRVRFVMIEAEIEGIFEDLQVMDAAAWSLSAKEKGRRSARTWSKREKRSENSLKNVESFLKQDSLFGLLRFAYKVESGMSETCYLKLVSNQAASFS